MQLLTRVAGWFLLVRGWQVLVVVLVDVDDLPLFVGDLFVDVDLDFLVR